MLDIRLWCKVRYRLQQVGDSLSRLRRCSWKSFHIELGAHIFLPASEVSSFHCQLYSC